VNWLSASLALLPVVVLTAPFLGLLGGFISGSETFSIAMLTALHLFDDPGVGFLTVDLRGLVELVRV
jgi:hypothetical protein